MATVTITLTDSADDDGYSVLVNFGPNGFDTESDVHQLATEIVTEIAQEDHKND